MDNETAQEEAIASPGRPPPRPGWLVVWIDTKPVLRVIPLGPRATVVGRTGGVAIPEDITLSGRHLVLARSGDEVIVTDVGSRNGTWVDGERIDGERRFTRPRVLRAGQTVAVFVDDVQSFEGLTTLRRGPRVASPRIRAVEAQIADAAERSRALLVVGETGTGKEWAAEHYHRASKRAGRFVAANCAALPNNLVESELFGAKKGSHSAATADRTGYILDADRGTLFLDEIGELQLDVQPKLLRVLESREVLRLGSTVPHKVDIGLVSATNVDLERACEEGRFRDDLYARIAQREVRLPPLRDRPEEIPELAMLQLEALKSTASITARAMEALLLRPWPRNVRGLFTAVDQAEAAARTEAKANGESAVRITVDHLPTAPSRASIPAPVVAKAATVQTMEDAENAARRAAINAALDASSNVPEAARRLGMSKSALYEEMKRLGVKKS